VRTRCGRTPTAPNAYNARALAYFGKGDRDRALRDFDEAIRINPKGADYFVGRGDIYRDRGDNERAVRDYDDAVRINPKNWYASYARGLADYNMGQTDRALRDADEAIRDNRCRAASPVRRERRARRASARDWRSSVPASAR
jgi:tetratricopeptide (TPR) repeat protein